MTPAPDASAFVRLPESRLWTLSTAYYEASGVTAFGHGEVPDYITSNLGTARQHADFLLGCTAGTEGPLRVLEIGAGRGLFARNLLRALEERGEPGRRLLGRLQYVLSDIATARLADLADGPLREAVAGGVVVPARFDLLDDGPPVGLDGRSLAGPFDLVIASYVCCTTPSEYLHRPAGGPWHALWVALDAEPDATLDDPTRRGARQALDWYHQWRPLSPAAELGDSGHAELLARLVARAGPEASLTLFLPSRFLTALGRLPLSDGGLVLVQDYGASTLTPSPPEPRAHVTSSGNATHTPVDFAVLAAWAEGVGWGCALTTRHERELHCALLQAGGALPPDRLAAFRTALDERDDGHALSDLAAAGMAAGLRGEAGLAARLFGRCLAVDPEDPYLLFGRGSALAGVGWLDEAEACLRRGQALDVEHLYDFDFELATVAHRRGDGVAARPLYLRSLARAETALIRVRLGHLDLAAGDVEAARASFRRALALQPGFSAAEAGLAACDAQEP